MATQERQGGEILLGEEKGFVSFINLRGDAGG